jgi:hypothetical protein
MNESKKAVQSIFPHATIRVDGPHHRVDGVPGLVAVGVSEKLAWDAAADHLRNPVQNASRIALVKERVMAAFGSLGGQVNQPMALVARVEALGWTPAESTAAINEMLAAAVLLRTDAAGIRMATK